MLAPFFVEVVLRPYKNRLLFHEAYPLLSYALSELDVRQQLTAARLKAFEQHVEDVNHAPGRENLTLRLTAPDSF